MDSYQVKASSTRSWYFPNVRLLKYYKLILFNQRPVITNSYLIIQRVDNAHENSITLRAWQPNWGWRDREVAWIKTLIPLDPSTTNTNLSSYVFYSNQTYKISIYLTPAVSPQSTSWWKGITSKDLAISEITPPFTLIPRLNEKNERALMGYMYRFSKSETFSFVNTSG